MKTRRPGRYVSSLTRDTVALILAGGRGTRLKALTLKRAKPATPFGGKYRIIDFPLSNCVNSGIRRIAVLTQYKAHDLIVHLQRAWGYFRGEFGEFVETLPAQQQIDSSWYKGTADAVYQNLEYLRRQEPELVLVLAGDHIYKMDYGLMLAEHAERGADVTVGTVEVPVERAREFGIVTIDEQNRINRFVEKPEQPEPMPGREGIALASMGIYVFNADFLERVLCADAENGASAHDFGRNIVPGCIEAGNNVHAYVFQDAETKVQLYWRDVGNVDAFYDANIELTYVSPELNLYDRDWPIWTYQAQLPPAKFILDDDERRGEAINSMVSGGCIVSGAVIRESVLFSNVRVAEQTTVERSIILPDVEIGRKCRIVKTIIDEDAVVPDGTIIGVDPDEDRRRFFVTRNGVVLVTADMLEVL
ncbi:glucose-1-phosphate adenylyltransferase [Thioalkalivibrio sp. XN8]|uniref:glucose-1-phosphate adenylyltransferase n=1 Tax=Thioalkalivibrio sp. XN8 TaxID=2712863 RepID=UPI0013EBE744|nr:glucose-1-phosphate adenylyltransferase [Thioalkalivibrio sp. XN8]NGP52971.1 glucose-1-phosphate adenylyltransferase [Thioalkalivibrio sp. XN8]